MKKRKKILLITHDGLMHSDDILSAALLKLYYNTLYPNMKVEIIRNRTLCNHPPKGAIVFDAGGGKLDHHSKDCEEISGGRPLSSLGKIWRWKKNAFIKVFKIDEISWKGLDQDFIKSIDLTDNTGIMNPFSKTINAYKVLYGGDNYKTFIKLVDVCMNILYLNLKAEEKVISDQREADELVQSLHKITINGKVGVMLDKWRPYGRLRSNICIDWIAWPTDRNDEVPGIKINALSFNLNNAGYYQNKTKESERIPGIVFVHKQGFTGQVETFSDLTKVI